MINAKKERVKMKGTISTLCAEYSGITQSMVEMLCQNGFDREKAVDKVREACRRGLMTHEELEAEAKRKMSEIFMDIVEYLNEESEDEANE